MARFRPAPASLMRANFQVNDRFEFKYLLTPVEYLNVTNALGHYFVYDEHSLQKADRRYFVRSLYYDTPHYQYYFEKIDGEFLREKVRFRTYEATAETCQLVKAEIKRRAGEKILKQTFTLSLDEYLDFENNGTLTTGTPERNEFLYKIKAKCLRPFLAVDYQREALFLKEDKGLRLTFDHNVIYAKAQTLFATPPFNYNLDRNIVMELKFADEIPEWLAKILAAQGLKAVPNSKYSNGLIRAVY